MSSTVNVIFLDIDGVLCTNRACVAMGNTGGRFSYLDPIACMLVRKLCIDNNAKIVISSAWRQEYNQGAMQAILNAACPGLGNYIWPHHQYWRTSDFDYENEWTETTDRGREIKRWIDANETLFQHFVILDDMGDMRPLQDSLVKCDCYDGFGYHNFMKAGEILQECA